MFYKLLYDPQKQYLIVFKPSIIVFKTTNKKITCLYVFIKSVHFCLFLSKNELRSLCFIGDKFMRLPSVKNKKVYRSPTARQIFQLRLKHRLTQAELGDIVCVQATTISVWERGERSMPNTLWRLACYELGEDYKANIGNTEQSVSLTDLINEMTEDMRNRGIEPL